MDKIIARKFLGIAVWILVPLIVFYFTKKPTKKFTYDKKTIFKLIIFGYLWSFFTIFTHESGHALAALSLGCPVEAISVGGGPKFFLQFGNFKLLIGLFPVEGFCQYNGVVSSQWQNWQKIIAAAMGVIVQFACLYLIHWWLKKKNHWQKNAVCYFCYKHALKITFWLTFVLNFPFFLPRSDWTEIMKILFGWK